MEPSPVNHRQCLHRPAPAAMLLRACCMLLLLLCNLPAQAARLALVIGNKDYVVGALKNPVNDAEAMAAALGGLGFQVTLVRNMKRDEIGRTVEGFAGRIRAGDDVVVFYAGHGLQVKGVNYLPAVDAKINVEGDVALNSLNLNELLQRLDESRAGVRLLLVDACRDNPYKGGTYRSNARGLARVEGAPSGTLMHFATRPGGVADDGSGRNGLYTGELLKHLGTPGLSVESLLKRVASGVRQASGGAQQPWTEGALDGEFYFAGAASVGPATAPPVQVANVVPELVSDASNRAEKEGRPPGAVFKDCEHCPEMVAIPHGVDAKLGPPSSTRVTRVGRPIAMARTETTVGQWKAFIAATGRQLDKGCYVWRPGFFTSSFERNESASYLAPGYEVTNDRMPVTCLSIESINAYAKWITGQSGRAIYRLPTVDEWEFSARNGTDEIYAWGNDPKGWIDKEVLSGFIRLESPKEVATGRPNAFNLFDMGGNVREMAQGCVDDTSKLPAKNSGLADVPHALKCHDVPGRSAYAMLGNDYGDKKPNPASSYGVYSAQAAYAGFRLVRETPPDEVFAGLNSECRMELAGAVIRKDDWIMLTPNPMAEDEDLALRTVSHWGIFLTGNWSSKSAAEDVKSTAGALGRMGIPVVIGPRAVGETSASCIGYRTDRGGSLKGATCLQTVLGTHYRISGQSEAAFCSRSSAPYIVVMP